MQENVSGNKQENSASTKSGDLLTLDEGQLVYRAIKAGLGNVGERSTPSGYSSLDLSHENQKYLEWLRNNPEFSDPEVEKKLIDAYEKQFNEMVADAAFEAEGDDF